MPRLSDEDSTVTGGERFPLPSQGKANQEAIQPGQQRLTTNQARVIDALAQGYGVGMDSRTPLFPRSRRVLLGTGERVGIVTVDTLCDRGLIEEIGIWEEPRGEMRSEILRQLVFFRLTPLGWTVAQSRGQKRRRTWLAEGASEEESQQETGQGE